MTARVLIGAVWGGISETFGARAADIVGPVILDRTGVVEPVDRTAIAVVGASTRVVAVPASSSRHTAVVSSAHTSVTTSSQCSAANHVPTATRVTTAVRMSRASSMATRSSTAARRATAPRMLRKCRRADPKARGDRDRHHPLHAHGLILDCDLQLSRKLLRLSGVPPGDMERSRR